MKTVKTLFLKWKTHKSPNRVLLWNSVKAVGRKSPAKFPQLSWGTAASQHNSLNKEIHYQANQKGLLEVTDMICPQKNKQWGVKAKKVRITQEKCSGSAQEVICSSIVWTAEVFPAQLLYLFSAPRAPVHAFYVNSLIISLRDDQTRYRPQKHHPHDPHPPPVSSLQHKSSKLQRETCCTTP